MTLADTSPSGPSSYTWLGFALLTVAFWGLYGVLLHGGVAALQPKSDPNARYKAFLFVGIAYFLTAVLAPALVLLIKGADWGWLGNGKAVSFSLLAGIVGAGGAFCVLLAFGAAPKPTARYVPVVMSIIFAGAPVVNAVAAYLWHPPEGGLSAVRWQFGLGIVLAAFGGMLVTLYKPA